MKHDSVRASVGRVALPSSRPFLTLVAAMFVAGLLGSMSRIQGRIQGETLFYLVNNPISDWGVIVTKLFWMLTIGIHLVSSGMAYRAKINPYMARVGFYVWLIGSILGRKSLKFNSADHGSVFQSSAASWPKSGGAFPF